MKQQQNGVKVTMTRGTALGGLRTAALKQVLVDAVRDLRRLKGGLTRGNCSGSNHRDCSEEDGAPLFPCSLDEIPVPKAISPSCLSQDSLTALGLGLLKYEASGV